MKPLLAIAKIPVQFDGDDYVVSDEIIGRLCRASETVIFDLLERFTPAQRANLAMHCYRRTHLRPVGLLIAATCDLVTFEQAFGKIIGEAIYAQSRACPDQTPRLPGYARNKISLATASEEGQRMLDDDPSNADLAVVEDDEAAEVTVDQLGALSK